MEYGIATIIADSDNFADFAYQCAEADGYPNALGDVLTYASPDGPEWEWYFHDARKAWRYYAEKLVASGLSDITAEEAESWANEELSEEETGALMRRVGNAVYLFLEALRAN